MLNNDEKLEMISLFQIIFEVIVFSVLCSPGKTWTYTNGYMFVL